MDQHEETTQNRAYEVTPLELFFDLVFAFAVSQLSHHLAENLSWHGVMETLVMLLAILAVWSYTSWAATIIHVSQSGARWMVLTVMLLGLFMNASVSTAFDAFSWAFAVPMLLIKLGRTAWAVTSVPPGIHRSHFVRVLWWFLATTPLWIAGAAAEPHSRLLWWSVASGVDLAGSFLAHPVPGRRLNSYDIPFDADHMLERCRLFVMIALGETVLTTGSAIAASPMDLMTLTTGSFALVGSVALWSLAFGSTDRIIDQRLEKTHNPMRLSHQTIKAVMAVVAGLIAVAVANEIVIEHPHGPTSTAISLVLVGGPTLFIAAQGWYLFAGLNVRSRLHVIGVGVLIIAGFATQAIPPYAALVIVNMLLAILAIFDQLSARRHLHEDLKDLCPWQS